MKKINPAARSKKNSHKNFDAAAKAGKTMSNDIMTLSDYFSARTISTASTAPTSTTNNAFTSRDF